MNAKSKPSRISKTPRRGRHDATCAELLALMNDYVDGDVKPALCRELEAHLARCKTCRVVLDNVKKTITLYRNGKPCRLPAGFHQRLHKALRACWTRESSES